ncbi:MAG TPA: hypothetical protein VGG12_08770 [Methylovirgula sp.]
MRIRRILFLLSSAACAAASFAFPAHAGAFLEPAGQGEIITSASFSDSTRFFDNNGKLIPIPEYQRFDLGSYIEYGASDRVTLVLQPNADIAHQDIFQPVQPFAATMDFGARFGLANFGSTVISVQALAHLPLTSTSTASALFDQDRAPGFDARLMLGQGFQLGAMPGFLDMAVSHTWLGDGLPDEWHAEATVGLRPIPKLMLLFASYSTLSPESVAITPSWYWLKLQPGVVYDLTPQWSIEGGFFATVIGQNAGRELGPTAAVWYRF